MERWSFRKSGKDIAILSKDPEKQYQLVVGTDSQPHNGEGVDLLRQL